MASLMVPGPDGRWYPACVQCGRETKRGRRLCDRCGARYVEGANTRAWRSEDPESPEPADRRSFGQRLAEGFAMLNGEHGS